MNYNDITYDKEIQWFADKLPVDLYNNTLRASIQWSISRGVIPDMARDFALYALREALDEYSRTKAKTRGGRVGRWFARILSFIIPKAWQQSK